MTETEERTETTRVEETTTETPRVPDPAEELRVETPVETETTTTVETETTTEEKD